MGITKHHLHNEGINSLSKVLRSLAHPARLRIVRHIIMSGDSNNKELAAEIGLSQSTISKHISELKAINMIQAREVETCVYYSLNLPLIEQVGVVFQMFFNNQQ